MYIVEMTKPGCPKIQQHSSLPLQGKTTAEVVWYSSAKPHITEKGWKTLAAQELAAIQTMTIWH